jgi:hypothetical protein
MSSYDNQVKALEVQVRDWMAKCPNCMLSPQVALHARRGTAMVQVGQSFEFDQRLKAYDDPPNYMVANRLVPFNGKVKNPIIFWLNTSFPRENVYQLHEQPVIHHVIRLGAGYTFAAVYEGLKTALKAEKVDIDSLGEWLPKKKKEKK